MMQCPLCGYKFEEGKQTICSTCPLNRGCNLVCCPNCGYEIPPEPTVIKLFKKAFNNKKKKQIQDV